MKTFYIWKVACLAMVMGLRAMPAMAQEQPVECFPQGTVWEEETYGVYAGNKSDCLTGYSYFRNTVNGEMTANGKTYKKVDVEMRMGESEDVITWDGIEPWHYEYAASFGIREEGGKVYYYGDQFTACDSLEQLAYDFNALEPGNVIPFIRWNRRPWEYETYTIQETGKVKLLNGNEYDCVVENGEPLLISTIGYVRKVFIFLDFINLRTEHRLMNFTRNGELVYEYTEPLGAELGIESAAKDGGFGEDIYTLQGVRLNGRDVSGLPKGIYIRGGKKYLVR